MTLLTLIELRLFLREKSGPIFGVGLPILLLVVFANIPFYRVARPELGGQTLLATYVPILVAFVLAVSALNVIPPVLAGYRERGVLRRLRTTPLGAARLLSAQLIMNLLIGAVTVGTLLLLSRYAFGVRLPRQPAGFLLAVLLAVAALLAVGMLVTSAANTTRSATALGAIVFYPMTFLGGLFMPIQVMPGLLRDISEYSPMGAAVLALQDAARGDWPQWTALLTLVAYAVVAGLAATRLFRWE